VFTIGAPAFDILFIGCVLNTKIVYTTAEKLMFEVFIGQAFKCCKMLLEDGEAWRGQKIHELVDAISSNAARCC